MTPNVRWMIRADFDSVCRIQNDCELPMSNDELREFMSKSTCICNVAEVDGDIVGYVLYEITSFHIDILSFAVQSDFRRGGIARGLISSLLAKLSERRSSITTSVPDSALPAQMLLKSLGFKAVAVEGSEYKFLARHE